MNVQLYIVTLLTGGLAAKSGDNQRMSSAVFRDFLVHAAAQAMCLGLNGGLSWTEARSVASLTFHVRRTL